MTSDSFYETVIMSQEELVDKITKTKNLNSIKLKLDKLVKSTIDKKVLANAGSMYMILEDAFQIDMYRFQFKAFIYTLNKEIKILEDFVSAQNAI